MMKSLFDSNHIRKIIIQMLCNFKTHINFMTSFPKEKSAASCFLCNSIICVNHCLEVE